MLQALTLRKPAQPVLKGITNPILLALGANLPSSFGAPSETITESVNELRSAKLDVRAVSRLFHTPAYPPSSGAEYINAAVLCESALSPSEILATLHRVEEKFGRRRRQRWQARTLDIDLLAVGDQILPDLATHKAWRQLSLEAQQQRVPDRLVLPHPRLQDRAFVLVPLADVAPDWVHPTLRLSVAEMLAILPASMVADICPI